MRWTDISGHEFAHTRTGRPPGAQTPLFVYGTLRHPEVLQGVIQRVPHGMPDFAPGWRVAALKDRVYPGLVPGAGEAAGLVITDLTASEWARLDQFEDERYALTNINLSSGGSSLSYVWPDNDAVLPENWDYGEFCRRHLDHYTRRFQKPSPDPT